MSNKTHFLIRQKLNETDLVYNSIDANLNNYLFSSLLYIVVRNRMDHKTQKGKKKGPCLSSVRILTFGLRKQKDKASLPHLLKIANRKLVIERGK